MTCGPLFFILTTMKIVLATRNLGKRREIEAMLGGAYELLTMDEAGFPPDEEIEEIGATFEENALLKARLVCGRVGMPVIADDSGLEVDALGGRPGVLSARFAGRHGDDKANNALLLDMLRDVPAPRRARFVCVAAMVAGEREVLARGECEGEIGFREDGGNGFGYDPLFVYNGVSFGRLGGHEKNAVSHRAVAFMKLARMMRDLF